MGDVVGFVSERHAWLRDLFSVTTRAGVSLRGAILGDGRLRLEVGAGPTTELTLVVRAGADGAPAFARAGQFSVGFEGTANLDARQREMVMRTCGVIERLDRTMPSALDGFSAIVRPSGDPAADLRRLFPFLDVERSRHRETGIDEVLVRATPKCNQACPFCSAPDHDQPDAEALLACFSAVSRWLPGATLTFTGGEPTLRPRFVDEITTARRHAGIGRVVVQTNAVLFATARDPGALPAGPDLAFFVSLHAVDPAIYDACTGRSGQLPAALDGIRRLLAAGHEVTLNAVVSRHNVGHLTELAEQLPILLPGDNRPRLHFSTLMCPEGRPEAAELLVPYREVARAVLSATEQAREVGLFVESPLSSTHASLPACTVPADVAADRPAPEIGAHETGYGTAHTPWVKAASCRSCRETAHCLGVPQAYAQRFGLDELVPLRGA